MIYQISDVLLALSNSPETTYNNMYLTAADFFCLETRNRAFVVPDKEKTTDEGYVGSGVGGELPTSQRSGYLIPIGFEISGGLSTGWAGVLARRGWGGADVVTVVEAGLAWEHKWAWQLNSSPAGRQLPSSTFLASLAAFDYLCGGGVVDTWQLRLPNAAAEPEFTAGLLMSGKRKRISEVAGFGSVAQPVPQNIMLGAESVVQYTDIDTLGNPRTIIMTSETPKRFRNLTFTHRNNHQTDLRSAGDERLVATSTTQGWFVGQMPHGVRAEDGEITFLADELNREYRAADEDIPITDFIIRTRGHYVRVGPTVSTLNQYTVETKIPKCFFHSPRGGGDPNAELTMALRVARDPITLGGSIFREVTGSSVAIL